MIWWALACTGSETPNSCEEVPPDREPGELYAASCETDDDCGEGYRCIEGAAGGYDSFYELTCTPTCQTDDDCPIVVDESCGGGPYCTMVECGDQGYCVESTCV